MRQVARRRPGYMPGGSAAVGSGRGSGCAYRWPGRAGIDGCATVAELGSAELLALAAGHDLVVTDASAADTRQHELLDLPAAIVASRCAVVLGGTVVAGGLTGALLARWHNCRMRFAKWIAGAVWLGSWYLMFLEITRWHHVKPSLAFNSGPVTETSIRPRPGRPLILLYLACVMAPLLFMAALIGRVRGSTPRSGVAGSQLRGPGEVTGPLGQVRRGR